ncbi:hypothetical protein [Saccharopolyspora hattusasensis]|uniref:hypothetical protein n=1 Tax=Saccharopolyspora hattusasensis TaxID=1128679 RepID=UPI003D95A768
MASSFRIGPDGVHVIDWVFPGAAAPWIDGASLVLRLVEAGHEPGAAESWADANLSAFADATGDHLISFAAYLAGMWSYWAATKNGPGMQHLGTARSELRVMAPATGGRRNPLRTPGKANPPRTRRTDAGRSALVLSSGWRSD